MAEHAPAVNSLGYLKVIFKNKWLIIAPAYIGLIVSTCVSFLIPPTYESYTLLMVEEQKTMNPIIEGVAVSTSIVQRMESVKEQILGWNTLLNLVRRLDLDKEIESQAQFEDFMWKLRDMISVETRVPGIIRLGFTSEDPNKAFIVAKTLSDIFIEENMRFLTRETDMAIEFLKNQLIVYRRKIKESEIADLRRQLAVMRLDSTDEHPLVRELKQRIVLTENELAKTQEKEEQPVTNEVRDLLKKELEKISETSAEATGKEFDPNLLLYKLFLMDKIDSSGAIDFRVNEEIYNTLLQKMETAKITQRLEASKQGIRYTVIDPPRLPLKPLQPNRFLVILVGALAGMGAGVGLVMTRQFIDHSYLDIEDAKVDLGPAILGAVSRITTREEMAREREKKISLIIIAMILSFALVTGTALFSFIK